MYCSIGTLRVISELKCVNQVHATIKLSDNIFHTNKRLFLADLYLGARVWRGLFFLEKFIYFPSNVTFLECSC